MSGADKMVHITIPDATTCVGRSYCSAKMKTVGAAGNVPYRNENCDISAYTAGSVTALSTTTRMMSGNTMTFTIISSIGVISVPDPFIDENFPTMFNPSKKRADAENAFDKTVSELARIVGIVCVSVAFQMRPRMVIIMTGFVKMPLNTGHMSEDV